MPAVYTLGNQIAGAETLFRSGITGSDATNPAVLNQAYAYSDYLKMSFFFHITSGSGSFKPQPWFWSDVFQSFAPDLEENLDSSTTNGILEVKSLFRPVAIKIVEFTETVAPFVLAISVRGINM